MEIKEIVGKLVGPIRAAGESHVDGKRLQNLEVHGQLVVDLVRDLAEAAETKDDHRASMNEIGTRADFWIQELKQWLPD
jgi:hypothetical protein